MKAADAIVKCLEKENVNMIFGYPGAATVPFYESLSHAEIQHILVRHEQAAVHAASGYARTTGKTGVCTSTSGPGATNLITGIATAYMDSIPIVVITGQVKSKMIGHDAFQEVDITGATEPFTKHSYLVKEAEELPRIIKEAFHIASTGRPGPVLIDIPEDLQNHEISFHYPEEVNIRGYKPTYKGHPGQIKRAIKRLKQSKKPVICAGGGVISSGAQELLEKFAVNAGIPVVHTLMGIGAVPTDSLYSIGLIGSHGFPTANKAVAQADVAMFIGARIADRATGGSNFFAKNADIIHIDIDPAEIGKNLDYTIPVVGDAKSVLEEMLKQIDPLDTEEWMREIKSWNFSNEQNNDGSSGNTVNPKYAIRLLSQLTEPNAVLTTDVGQNQLWAARNYVMKGKRKFLSSGGLGTMGYSLPTAVGAKIGNPEQQVVAVVGDGGFQMSMSELGTILQQDIKLTILLFNNQRLGMVRELQDKIYHHPFGVYMDRNPDFLKIAEAYGFASKRVNSNDQLKDALKEALESEKTFLLECIIDPNEGTL